MRLQCFQLNPPSIPFEQIFWKCLALPVPLMGTWELAVNQPWCANSLEKYFPKMFKHIFNKKNNADSFQKVRKHLSSGCDGHLGTWGGFWQWINLDVQTHWREKGSATPVAASIILAFRFILKLLCRQYFAVHSNLLFRGKTHLSKEGLATNKTRPTTKTFLQ